MRGVVRALVASVAVLAAGAGQAQALTVTRALLSGGTLTVSGYENSGSAVIRWEGRVVTKSDPRGGFTFTTTVVPGSCTGTLSDGTSAIGVGIDGCTVESPPSPAGVLVTGQTECWSVRGDGIACHGTRQDGDIRAGVALRYTSHANGTITDMSTGLVWEKKTAANQFDAYLWDEAFEYVAGLNALRFGGYDDWRLPNLRELASLIDYGTFNPAVAPELDDCDHGSCTVAGSYWSSTSAVSAPFLAWRVNFYDGAHLVGGKNFTIRVRAVRGGS